MKREQAVFVVTVVGVIAAILFLAPQQEQSSPQNSDSSYPNHPSLSECEEVQDQFERQFCFSDVAEMEGDAELCGRIGGNYSNIQRFCEARINLNESKCRTLNDQYLVESCLESIEMKQEWG
ncbi:MAG: hypothetical protein MUP63_03665 [Candidatus Nanohaloarchaeota archaeon QJJ-7]|nr:hypothetical protein [Candidatus Nanohaloarchaeota archaeon QJJ-7]